MLPQHINLVLEAIIVLQEQELTGSLVLWVPIVTQVVCQKRQSVHRVQEVIIAVNYTLLLLQVYAMPDTIVTLAPVNQNPLVPILQKVLDQGAVNHFAISHSLL